jgi:hypothetical protein
VSAVEVYVGDPAAVINVLVSAENLNRYVAWLEHDAGSQAEASQHAMARHMTGMVSRIGAEGLEAVAAADRPAIDALLTDVFAVATWHGWALPVTPEADSEVSLDGWQRGLLGADANQHGAVLYCQGQRLALRRSRDEKRISVREWH